MATTHNLPDNRTLVKGYFQDGLFEMAIGLALVLVGCTLLLPDTSFILWYLPWMLIWLVLPQAKKQQIAPRGGVVQMPVSRRLPPRIAVLLGLLVLATLGLVLFTSQDRRPAWILPILGAIGWVVQHFPLVVGVGVAAVFVGLGLRGSTPRFYAYAVLLVVGGTIAELSIASSRIGALGLLIGVGTPILIVGAFLFVAYRREHPLLNRNDQRS